MLVVTSLAVVWGVCPLVVWPLLLGLGGDRPGKRKGICWREMSLALRAVSVSSGREPVWRATRGYFDPTRRREKPRVRSPGR
jgi:hypothetical protein